MKRVIKKTAIVMLITLTTLFASSFLTRDAVYADNYQSSSSWVGADVGVSPLAGIVYDSDYRPFSDVIDNYLLVDVNKTYVIETAYDLYMFSELSRSAHASLYLSLDYVLGKDIDYFNALQENITYLFTPIGFNTPFSGTFDGQGYEITNLIFRSVNSTEDYDTYMPGLIYYSMFSKTSENAVIENLGLINPLIVQAIEEGAMTHVSVLVGENRGLVRNVYYLDNRGDSSGLNAEGNFFIAGLVSRNIGTVSNAFVSSSHIRSLAVINNLSTSVLVYSNSGTLDHLYYDSDVYQDEATTSVTNGVGLATIDFQNDAYFSTDWYFRDSYTDLTTDPNLVSQTYIENTYPTLQGVEVSEGTVLIEDAVDFVYMNELLNVSGLFRASNYIIIHDIDMNQVSRKAYQSASVGFSGTLSSSLISGGSTLYTHDPGQGGAYQYHTIIGLKISETTLIGNYASYALFSSLFGSISHLNFWNFTIIPEDLAMTANRDKVLIGGIAASSANGSVLTDVHLNITIDMPEFATELGQLLIGGLIGEGSAEMNHVTTNGLIDELSLTYSTRSNQSAVAGFIGHATNVSVDHSLSNIHILGLHYTNTPGGVNYYGGLFGYGVIHHLEKIVNAGNVSTHTTGFINQSYLGGIIGYQVDLLEDVSYTYNAGDLTQTINRTQQYHVAGFGTVEDLEDNLDMMSLSNHAQISLNMATGMSDASLAASSGYVSGVLISYTNGQITGLFQSENQAIDVSAVTYYAGTLLALNQTDLTIEQAYQSGNINFMTSNKLAHQMVHIALNVFGTNLSQTHLRQTGDANIYLSQETISTITNGALYIYGVIQEVSQDFYATDLFNGGDITLNKDSGDDILYNVYIGGIGYHNRNTNLYAENNINPASIDIETVTGSVDTVLNEGNISVRGDFDGHVKVAGILVMNGSMLTNAINLGNLDVRNDALSSNDMIEAGGIVYLMISQYAQIRDAANNGDVYAVSTSSIGYAHAAGIAVRNELNENLSVMTIGSSWQLAKIMFSINYGNIYAYNGTNENSYSITTETRSKASAIFGIGLLSVVNNFNYGNVFSRYLGAGIFGFLYYNRFGAIATDQVFISNNINYGKVRQVTGYNKNSEAFTYNMSTTPNESEPYAFGAMVGKIHNGSTSWSFLGDTTYAIDRVYFGYLLNFDARINMFASAPTPTSSWYNLLGGDSDDANALLLQMLAYMATTNPADESAAPFTRFLTSGWIAGEFSRVITYLNVSEAETGMFYEGFSFRSQRPVYSGTDQYIADYIDYIPEEKVNPNILTKIESDTAYNYPGIYALASSSGIGNGIFIPDNFDVEGLHPYILGSSDPQTDWLGTIGDNTSISYVLYEDMRQIKASFATTIYNLEIMQTDLNGNPITDGLTLSNPVVDDERGLLTYYIPSNAQILGSASPSVMDVATYTEAGPGVPGVRVVPEIPGSGPLQYAYIGTHAKVGSSMNAIGPYASAGIYNLVSQDNYGSPYNSSSTSTSVYDWTIAVDASGSNVTDDIFSHVPHTRTRFLFWYIYDATGYRVSTTGGTQAAGYGAYRRISYTYSWGTTVQIYDYVGPNPVLESYVYSGQIDDADVYAETNVRFKANTDESSYVISENASLIYGGSDQQVLVSIPRAYGIYENMVAGSTYIDSVSDHYGSVRVFSASYNPADPSTYRDYEIRIIRTADESITDLDTLFVNGQYALPGFYNYTDVNSTVDLYYEYDGTNGRIIWTYDTYNMPDLYQITPLIELFDNNTQIKVSTSLYRLTQGTVETDGTFNNQTGSWGTGSVETRFIIEDDFPSGNYTLRLTLVSGLTYEVTFDKMESANATVLSMTYQGEVIEPTGMSYTSEIPYGIYYQAGNAETDIVDFSNLSSLNNVYYTDVSANLPDYLEDLTLSNFTTIDDINLTITIVNGYQHRYAIAYHLIAEDNTTTTFTHYLLEAPLAQLPVNLYKNGGVLNSVTDPVTIYYEEAPTVRVEYGFDDVFFPGETVLSMVTGFTPLDIGDNAIQNEDYYVQTVDGMGFEVDFNQETPKGEYTFRLTYSNAVTLWGQTISWSRVMNTVYANKLRNDNSHLVNVLFASESVFDEVLDAFNTIIEVDEVTPLEYEQYYDPENPTQREIVALPTSGIDYDIYYDYQAYWVVGQVQQTNLSAYLPTMYIPDGASIYRVIDEINMGYEFQSDVLAADFADYGTGESLNYVHYRIYAEDYDDDPLHYTDYYIAVQDTTNNIKFDVTVINETDQRIDEVFVHVNVAQVSPDYEDEITNEMIAISMNLFSYYDPETLNYTNNQFMTSMYGRYMVYVDLPDGFDVDIEFQQAFIDGSSMYLESSRIPRRYYVTIHIIESTPETPDWGYQAIFAFDLYEDALVQGFTYQPGDRFMYNDMTYEVQTGYTYTFNGANEPGVVGSLGIRNVDLDYDPYSTYLIGDIVFENGAYYQALSAVINNVTPNQTSVNNGTWYEFSVDWLSYNHYEAGTIVYYNGNYYTALASSHNANPETNPSLWELQLV